MINEEKMNSKEQGTPVPRMTSQESQPGTLRRGKSCENKLLMAAVFSAKMEVYSKITETRIT